jgi:hypothetical protein
VVVGRGHTATVTGWGGFGGGWGRTIVFTLLTKSAQCHQCELVEPLEMVLNSNERGDPPQWRCSTKPPGCITASGVGPARSPRKLTSFISPQWTPGPRTHPALAGGPRGCPCRRSGGSWGAAALKSRRRSIPQAQSRRCEWRHGTHFCRHSVLTEAPQPQCCPHAGVTQQSLDLQLRVRALRLKALESHHKVLCPRYALVLPRPPPPPPPRPPTHRAQPRAPPRRLPQPPLTGPEGTGAAARLAARRPPPPALRFRRCQGCRRRRRRRRRAPGRQRLPLRPPAPPSRKARKGALPAGVQAAADPEEGRGGASCGRCSCPSPPDLQHPVREAPEKKMRPQVGQ